MSQKKIVFWAPFRGRIGTIEALLNYYKSLESDYEVYILQVAGEWDAWAEKMPKATFISVWDSAFAKRLGVTNTFHRRDFYLLVLVSIFKVRRIVRAIDPHAVIAFLQLIPFAIAIRGISCSRLATLQGTPSFVLGSAQIEWYKKIEQRVRHAFWSRILPSFDSIICMTESSTAAMQNRFASANVVHIDNALFDRSPLIHDYSSQVYPKALVFIGRLEYQKNPQRFLEIAKNVRSKEEHKWEIHIFGDGSLRPELERLADPRIVFHGHVENAWDKVRAMNAVHLVTSRWEDPGHAIIEGLVRKVPTVIEDNGADYLNYYRNVHASLVVSSNDIVKKIIDIEKPADQVSLTFLERHSVKNLQCRLREILEIHSF